MRYKIELSQAIDCCVELPASKSIGNRALIINALARGAQSGAIDVSLCNVAQCDDCDVLMAALTSDSDHIDVGASGTALRFLTAYFALQDGRTVVLDGTERLRQRPVGELVDALRQMGADIDYLGQEGFPPLKITGKRLHGSRVVMRGDVSSQFVSALLMIAPVVGGLTLCLDSKIVSRPYIEMTLVLMRHYGVQSQFVDNTITVPAGRYQIVPLAVEGDWSAAAYWLALQALLPQSHIVLKPLTMNSVQGDSAIVEIMEPLGVKVQQVGEELHLSSCEVLLPSHYEREMSATPDLVPPLVVTLCLLRIPFTLSGVRTLRIKESDRLAALQSQLGKLGYEIVINEDSISGTGCCPAVQGEVVLDSCNDHRIAMSLALAATRHKGLIVSSAEAVSKSYPQFWQQLLGKCHPGDVLN